ncbi:response regulator [Geomonas subterranea]|uniref:histidine kinase n=1 Tax=Geomonas subterranea TaxID=2847989 RepID=A0ABX8LJ64_9BACT|nr:response regulator [Geomonas subterranea]QXE92090.1 response regulator [Geomonas subterranea]QXM09815.1 response regulator [Geomonas subterranea]
MTTAAPGSGFKLLYVEDDDITRQTVLTLLERRFPGLAIQAAHNGKEAMELYGTFAPDLIVTDIKMPVMSGIEMARRLLERKPSLPVIVTSAHSDMEFLLESIELGIARYVLKPIDSGKLFASIDACLTTLSLERELQEQQAFVRKLSRAVQQSPTSIVITDPQGIVEYVNPKFRAFTGAAEPEPLGRPLAALLPNGEEIWARVKAGGTWHGEVEGVGRDGLPFYQSSSVSPVMDESGAIANFVAVQEDITERVRNEREIEQLNLSLSARAEELEIANRDLEGFSYTVSHDLRTPLTNINGYCQVILELYGATLEEGCKEFINVILNETISMNQLIRTLLEFSRVTRAEMAKSPVNLSEMATLIAAARQLAAPGRKICFTIEPDLDAYGDPDLLKVVLENLISNACKYSGKREQAVIEFRRMERDGEAVYLVRDNGAGFDMSQADRLFSPFQRLHSEREFNGFGVGLATVQRIIQRHGGRVWAEGEVDQGACFYFTLPGPQPK